MATDGDQLRVGFIGCGTHATNVIWPCLRYAPIEIAYACAASPERANRNRRLFGADRATTSVDEVLEDDSVQAVFVVGPPTMHHEIGLRVLWAGKHLFIEKPPGITLSDALELDEAARRNGMQCQVAFQKRFALAYGLARDAAARPEFGGVRLCKVNYSHWAQPDWRTHLTGMSVHPLDLVRFFMGDPAAAYVVKRSADDGRSTCVLMLVYEGGASAVVNLSANDPHVQEWVELSGANQLVSVRNLVEYRHWADGTDPPATLRVNEAAVEVWHPEFAIAYDQADSMRLQGYAGQVVEFATALLEGRPVTPSIADGVIAMRYVEAIAAAPEGLSELDLRTGDPTVGGNTPSPARDRRILNFLARSRGRRRLRRTRPGSVAEGPGDEGQAAVPRTDGDAYAGAAPVRLSCSTLTFRMVSLEEALARISAAGLRAVDLTAIPQFCPHADPLAGAAEHVRVRDLLARAGMRASSLNVTSLTHLNDANSAELEYLRASLRLAAAVRAPVVTVQAGRSVVDEEWVEAAARVAEALNDLGTEARGVGAMLTVEAPHAGTLAEDFDRACRLLELLDPDLVGVTLDTSHVLDAGATIGRALEQYGYRVRHVHLRDYRDGDVLVTPGDGQIDFGDAIGRLAAVGYAGDLSLELEYHDASVEKNERELRRAVSHLRAKTPQTSLHPRRAPGGGPNEGRHLRAGIVGCGLRGEAHISAMRRSGVFDPVALCDVDEQRLAAVGERHQIGRLYTDVTELVERDRVDLVAVVTPPAPRAGVVERAVAAGARYLLLEKPIALHPRDTSSIRALGENAAIAVNTQYQWMPHWLQFWPRLEAGALGEIEAIRCSTRANVISQGSHTGDLALRGARACGLVDPEWILAGIAGVDLDEPVPVPSDFAATIGMGDARMFWNHGPSAPTVRSEAIHFYQIQIDFLGTRGRLWVSLNQGWTLWTDEGIERGATEWPGDDELAQVALLRDLARAIRDDAMDEFPTRIEQAARVEELIFAGYASALGGDVVRLPREPEQSDVERLPALTQEGHVTMRTGYAEHAQRSAARQPKP